MEDSVNNNTTEQILVEIRKNPLPIIGLIWRIIEEKYMNLLNLIQPNQEIYKKEFYKEFQKNSDVDNANFQIPAITNYTDWSRLLMDFLFKNYKIGIKEQTNIMKNGVSNKELRELFLKQVSMDKKNMNNVLCAGLTEILILYFQNMEYTKHSAFDFKKKEKGNKFIYDARLRHILRELLKVLLNEYKIVCNEKIKEQSLVSYNKKFENLMKTFEIENEKMRKMNHTSLSENDFNQRIDNLLKEEKDETKIKQKEMEENVNEEFSLIIQEVENRVSCLLWEQYQRALESQKKKNSSENDQNSEYLKNEKGSAKNKWMMWGLATIGSGIIIGVTGGLAAPIVGAGLGTLGAFLGITSTGLIASLGAFLTTASGVAIFGALFGLTGGGLTAYNFHKVFSGLKEFKFLELPYQKGADKDIDEFIIEHNEINNNKSPNNTTKNPNSSSGPSSSLFSPLNKSIQMNTPNKLNVIICISGWLSSVCDIYKPWNSLIVNQNTMSSNIYSLKFDSKTLIDLGQAMESMIVSGSITFTVKQLLKQTILGGVVSGLIWPVAMVQMGTMIDNPWTAGLDKSERAGKVLAREVLLKHIHGKRPVTLVGYSLGARVIYYCLLELWKYSFEISSKKNKESSTTSSFLKYKSRRGSMTSSASISTSNQNDNSEGENPSFLCHSIIDSVYMFGTPVDSNPVEWAKVCAMASGRVVNGYCQTDWVLSFLFRASTVCTKIAGLQKVNVPNIENINLSSIVSGHLEYKDKLEQILEYVGFENGVVVVNNLNEEENNEK